MTVINRDLMSVRKLSLGILLGCTLATTAHAQTPSGGAAKAQSPGALPMGRYDCRDEITGPLRMMGYFTLSADGSYQYLTKPEGRGKYRYDRASGVIEWLSGPYAKDEEGAFFRAIFSRTSAGTPMITLRLVSPGVEYADADYCFLRS